MIPGGLTKKLQVLDISVNKYFKSLLRKKWEEWMIQRYHEFIKSGHIKRASYQTVCEWISFAWSKVPVSAIKSGFKKTRVNFYSDELYNEGDEESDIDGGNNSDDEKVQEKLLNIFTQCQLTDSEYESD